MPVIAARHNAGRLHRDIGTVDQHQVLRRCDPAPRGVERLIDRLGAHDFQGRADGRVIIAQRRPRDRRHMARRGDGAQVTVRPRQNRSVIGPALGDRDGLFALDGDDAAPCFKRFPPVGCAVFIGVFGVHLFDIDVEVIQIGGRIPPCQLIRPPDQNNRRTGDGAANHAAGRQFHPCQIPDRRCAEPQMRVVRHQGPTRG